MSNQIEDAIVPAVDEQLEEIKFGARILFNQKQLVEVRARGTDGYWKGLYFTDHDLMAEVVKRLDHDNRIQSIYYVFNKINPKLVEQRKKCECDKCARGGLVVANPTPEQVERILTGPSQHLTQNEDVENLNWLFIDVDTIRAPGMEHESSTVEEKKGSKAVAKQIIDYLKSKDWPEPLLADSGNGFHIMPRLNLPNNDTNIELVLDCMKALAVKFNNSAAHIDESVRNAARLTRAYGTHTRKGINTTERPFRMNKVYKPKAAIVNATMDQVLALGSEGPKTSKTPRGDMPLLHASFEPDDFFRHYAEEEAFSITGIGNWQGHTVAITDHCVISGTKHTGSKLTGFIIGDSFGYHCWSPECNDPNIGDVLRKLHEDGYKHYPKKIWIEEDLTDFAEDVTALELAMEAEKKNFEAKPEVKKPEATPVEKPVEKIKKEDLQVFNIEEDREESPFQTVEVKVREEVDLPPPSVPAPEAVKAPKDRLVGKEPNDLATWLLGVIFRNPEKTYPDYVMYRKRLEKIAPHLKAPIGEALACLLLFEIEIRHLPTRAELKDYILNHPTCKKHKSKEETCRFIDELIDDKTKTFDVTVQALLEEVQWRLEKKAALKAYQMLDEERDIQGFRTTLRKHWSVSMTQDSNFQPGSWQEKTEEIIESFRRDVAGEGDERKFKLGFDSIDNSGMNVGLDGEHAIVLYGPQSGRKTTAALTMAYNFAKQGKHGLFFAGEHQSIKIEKRLSLMFMQELREKLGTVPSLNNWEGLNRTASWDDFEKIAQGMRELKAMRIVPGYLEPQNINAIARGEIDRLGSILAYAEATFKKYQWDFLVIDPLDTVMPGTQSSGEGNWKACSEIVDRLFDFSRDAFGGKGCLVLTTAQFGSGAQRDIAKIQQKNEGADDWDDEIVGILRRDSLIQYFTTIGQRFDLGIGVSTRTKKGSDGMMVQGRSREGGYFDVVDFKIDEFSNLMMEKQGASHSFRADAAAAQGEAVIPHGGYDDGL